MTVKTHELHAILFSSGCFIGTKCFDKHASAAYYTGIYTWACLNGDIFYLNNFNNITSYFIVTEVYAKYLLIICGTQSSTNFTNVIIGYFHIFLNTNY